MNVSQHHGWDPITQTDDVIETALLDTNVPALMAALVHVTGILEFSMATFIPTPTIPSIFSVE